MHGITGQRNEVLMDEALWKNKLQFVKDVDMICVNLIIIVIVVTEKRKGITFVQRCCTVGVLSYYVADSGCLMSVVCLKQLKLQVTPAYVVLVVYSS
jgi:hypothetical protein